MAYNMINSYKEDSIIRDNYCIHADIIKFDGKCMKLDPKNESFIVKYKY